MTERLTLYDPYGVPLPSHKKPGGWFWFRLIGLAAIILGSVFNFWNIRHLKAAAARPIFAQLTGDIKVSLPVDEQPATVTTDPAIIDAANFALRQWEAALHRKIRRPRLYKGAGYCSVGASACADTEHYTINVVLAMDQATLRSAMLHEVGHLLGVPHIEGDPLMDRFLSGNVTKPTPFAIALAKLAHPTFGGKDD